MNITTTLRARIEQNGFALSRTTGDSMRPLIWGGDHCVIVVPLDGRPRVGDLLLFVDTNRRPVVHRVVDIVTPPSGHEPLYTTRGDNCIKTETVGASQIVGRVAEVHRISGYRPWHILPQSRYAVTDPSYMAYTYVWTAIWPLRRLYYIFRYHCTRVFKV